MSGNETRALARAAALLLIASTARWGWFHTTRTPAMEGPDALAGVLEASRAGVEEQKARSRALGPEERLDPNRATAVELDRLPGVGEATAGAIVSAREARGGFRSLEDLLAVRGIGPATLEKLRPHLDLSPSPGGSRRGTARNPPPTGKVDVNRDDETALQELPGVGPALARRIVEARRVAPFKSVGDLIRVRGIGPATLSRIRDQVTIR